MTKEKTSPKLKESLKELQKIVAWFDDQEEADVEAGLEKVKKGAILIKESRKQLKKLENEFEKVKQELEEDGEYEEERSESTEATSVSEYPEADINPEEIPF